MFSIPQQRQFPGNPKNKRLGIRVPERIRQPQAGQHVGNDHQTKKKPELY